MGVGYRVLDPDVLAAIVAMRDGGMTLAAIGRQLDDEGIPTAGGARWYPSTIRAALRSQRLDDEAEAVRANTGAGGSAT